VAADHPVELLGGESLLNALGLPEAEAGGGRDEALGAMIEVRTANRSLPPGRWSRTRW
jgi:hypothetical protein